MYTVIGPVQNCISSKNVRCPVKFHNLLCLLELFWGVSNFYQQFTVSFWSHWSPLTLKIPENLSFSNIHTFFAVLFVLNSDATHETSPQNQNKLTQLIRSEYSAFKKSSAAIYWVKSGKGQKRPSSEDFRRLTSLKRFQIQKTWIPSKKSRPPSIVSKVRNGGQIK